MHGPALRLSRRPLLIGLLLLAPAAGVLLRRLALRLHRPPAPPLVLVIVPGLGAADLEAGLRDGSLPRQGLMRQCMRYGRVCRRITPVHPPTSAALLGTLLSGRTPATTGVTMSRLPSPHRRLSATVPGLHPRRLRWVLPRERPLRPTLSLGFEPDLLPLGAHRATFHEHGHARGLPLPRELLEDADTAGWILPSGTGPGARSRSLRLPVPEVDSPAWLVVDLLLPGAGEGHAVPVVYRDRDAVDGQLPRSGTGWWLQTSAPCLASPFYLETLDLVVAVDRRTPGDPHLRVSELTHLITTPPDLATRLLPASPVCRPGAWSRWRDAERLALLEHALDLAEHERLLCLLEGPRRDGEAYPLDRRLGRLAGKVRDRQGILVVVGLGRGAPARQGIDLPRMLPRLLGPCRSGDLAVVAEEGVARVELGRPTRTRRAWLEAAAAQLLGAEARLGWVARGSLSVQAAPGVSLDGRPRLHVMGGTGPLAPHAGLLLSCGPAVVRHQDLEQSAVQVHRWLRGLWTGRGQGPATAPRCSEPAGLSASCRAPASCGPP